MDYTVQVQRVVECGSQPEDWLILLRCLETDPHLLETTNRYRSLCSMYNSALKNISLDKHKTNPAYAQICINFAKLKMTHDPDDARMLFKYARANIKTISTLHVEAAQFELDQGDRDKCKDILKKAQNLKAEPSQLVTTAIQRFNKGMASLYSEKTEDNVTDGHSQKINCSSKPPVAPHNTKVPSAQPTSGENTTKPSNAPLNPLPRLLTPSHSSGQPSSGQPSSGQPSSGQPSSGQPSGQSSGQAHRHHGQTATQAQPKESTPVFHEYADSTISFGREASRKRQSSGASSSDDADTIPWLFNKPREQINHPTASSGLVMSQSASKIKRGDLNTPDCKSLPVCSSVGASRKQNRTNYGLPQRVKRTVMKLPDTNSTNADDSDDDFSFPDVKPLEKTSPPHEVERLTAILESPQQASNDSGVAMATPTTEQQPPTLSKTYSNRDTLLLHTPSQQNVKSQILQQSVDKGTDQKRFLGKKPDVDKPNESESIKLQSALSARSVNGKVQLSHQADHGLNQVKAVCSNNGPQFHQQMNPPLVIQPLPVQKKDIISVNKVTYNTLKVIGKGGSSKVYQVFSQDKKKVLAIKHVKLDCADDMTIQGYINEITLLQKLRKSENIIHLYDYEITESHIYLVMECGSIDLASFLSKHKKIDPQNMKFYWRGMLDAVDVVHQAGIVHSDLKPANFLFVEGTLKLIDFGIANAIQSDKTSVIKECQVGTLNYMSPEAIQDTSPSPQVDANGHRRPKLKINCKSDVWSLGCIFYYMVYGKTPFQHITLSLVKLQAICDPRHVIEFPAVDDPHLLDLLQKCLIRDPRDRPSIQELRRHPFFQEAQPVQEEPSKPNLTEEHLKTLISQLSQAQINSPTSITAVSKMLMQQLQSGQQFDISTALKPKPGPFQPLTQQQPPPQAPPPPQKPTFDLPHQCQKVSHPRPGNRIPLQVVQMEQLQQAQSSLKPLCISQSSKYMRQESTEKENQDLADVLRGQLARKYQNAIPMQITEEQTYEQTWRTETMK